MASEKPDAGLLIAIAPATLTDSAFICDFESAEIKTSPDDTTCVDDPSM